MDTVDGWGLAVNIVDQAKNLNPGTKLVYRIMLSSLYRREDSECSWTEHEIARKCNLTARMVRNHVQKLIEVKLIAKAKKGRNNKYLFFNPKEAKLTRSDAKQRKHTAGEKRKFISHNDAASLFKNDFKTTTKKKAIAPETDFPCSRSGNTKSAAAAFISSHFSMKDMEHILQKYGPSKVLAVKRRFDRKQGVKNPAGLIRTMLEDKIPEGELTGAAGEEREKYLERERKREEAITHQEVSKWLKSLPKEEAEKFKQNALKQVELALQDKRINRNLKEKMLMGALNKEYEKWRRNKPQVKTIGEVLQGEVE